MRCDFFISVTVRHFILLNFIRLAINAVVRALFRSVNLNYSKSGYVTGRRSTETVFLQ